MMHICVSKLTIIISDNGLLPGRHQAIIWTNAGILFTWLLGTNFSEILIEKQPFSLNKMHLKMLSVKWGPFCLGLNMVTGITTVRLPWHLSIISMIFNTFNTWINVDFSPVRSCGINLMAISQELFKSFENYTSVITAIFPRGQWINYLIKSAINNPWPHLNKTYTMLLSLPDGCSFWRTSRRWHHCYIQSFHCVCWPRNFVVGDGD